MFEKYSEIVLDENPLIFLSCGHFYTVSSLDGIMELTQHYVTDPLTGKAVRPMPSRRVVASGSSPKGCPECRTPLRDIDRYNRIVKKALLDEATRRFVTQANSMCVKLVKEIQERETEIEDERGAFMREWLQVTSQSRDLDIVRGSLDAYQEKGRNLLRRINKFTKSVAKTEQPFGKVNSLFASAVARRRDITTSAFELDESVIQTGFQFRGQCFSLRLNWAILWDFDIIYNNNNIDSRIRLALRNAIATPISGLMSKCRSLIDSSRDAKLPQHEAEGRIYHALFSILSLSSSRARGQQIDIATEASTRQQERDSLEECESLCSRYPGTMAYLRDDIEKAKRLVNGGTFYSFVTTEEKREVYRAMAAQFSGTGHWYYCRNNHPVRSSPHRFTLGTNHHLNHSSPSESAECPWKKPGVRNARSRSEVIIILSSQGSAVQET
jgi:hypothetical protein